MSMNFFQNDPSDMSRIVFNNQSNVNTREDIKKQFQDWSTFLNKMSVQYQFKDSATYDTLNALSIFFKELKVAHLDEIYSSSIQ